MKHGIIMKFIAVLLAAMCLVFAAGGTAGIVAMESAGLYVNGLDMLRDQEYLSIADTVAKSYADYYAAKNLSNLTYAMRESEYANPKDARGDAEHWLVQIRYGGVLLDGTEQTAGFALVKEYTIAPIYPIVSVYAPGEEPEEETETDKENLTPDAAYESVPPAGYLYHEDKTSWTGISFETYHYYYYEAPEYQISVYMQPEVLESSALHILTSMYPYRYGFIALLVVSVLLFACCVVYLIWVAGRRKDAATAPGGVNRLPLDLYLLAAAGTEYALWELLQKLVGFMEYEGPHFGNLSLIALNVFAMALPMLGFIMALSAQTKVRGYFWKTSLLGRLCAVLKKGICALFRGFVRFINVVPAVWQWVLFLGVVGGAVLCCGIIAWHYDLWILFGVMVLCGIGVVCYSGYAYGVLLAGTHRMAQGQLDIKIPTKYLFGSFRKCASYMNDLADVATEAARNQVRAERMRTELITNVSHDIKTPLTSIINYVDLLGKPHTPEDQQQYLEVLGRQSGRMKRLIEDLVEMSKASSGSMKVNMITLNATESVNQALGEFSDKLEKQQLSIVYQPPKEPINIQADGRLSWRVLSNLLSNVVKYAMPGTRVYVEITQRETTVEIAVKNISKEPLQVPAQELTERFVRGDTSRNTEGSGLGLHIAKNLMELQKGSLELQADGDLFKVTIRYLRGE